MRHLETWILTVSVGLALAGAMPAVAATIAVDSTADDFDQGSNGNCTLREAILAANRNAVVDACAAGQAAPVVDVVAVPAGTYLLAIGPRGDDAGEHGDLDLTDDVDLQGSGAGLTVVDAAGIDRVFDVAGGAIVRIFDLEARGGDAGSGDGGGIENDGELTLTGVVVSGNQALGPGGGIRNNSLLTVRRSLVSGNLTADHGGGLDDHGTSVLENSTFSGNDGANQGGGVYNLGGQTMTMTHCTLHDNTAAAGAGLHNAGDLTASNSLISGPCDGTVNTSGGGNLESPGDTCGLGAGDVAGVADPRLGPLAANGGTTGNHALLAGSPAIDAAAAGPCLSEDQRGVARPLDGDGDSQADCDAGAYEAEARPASIFADGFESGDTSGW